MLPQLPHGPGPGPLPTYMPPAAPGHAFGPGAAILSTPAPGCTGSGDEAPTKKRGTVACRRCRRLRSKCVHTSALPPCEACGLAGSQIAAECAFPRKGERDTDRRYRRRPVPVSSLVPSPFQPTIPAGRLPARPLSPLPQPQGLGTNPPSRSGIKGGSGPTSGFDQRGQYGQPHRGIEPSMQSPYGKAAYSTGHPTPANSGSLSLAGIIRGDGNTPTFPPLVEAVEGCRVFVTSYFQLGFIPKAAFLDTMARDPFSINTFLLACILSVSARFTPALVRRYGSARRASDHFLEVARGMAPSQMYNTSLQSIQAFFLLAIAQWGHGDKDPSSENMSVALRMAFQLRLHREDSYAAVESSGSADQFVKAESARRTFWMIYSQDNLHSGYKTPVPFQLDEISTLLPCDEDDFAFGNLPRHRSALAGTPPALANLRMVSSPDQCLFATLIQAHGLWGKVARSASHEDHAASYAPPWEPNSEYQCITAELRDWEDRLPPRQRYYEWNFEHWKSKNAHLAFLSVTMVLRLGNIVARRMYMEDILKSMSTGGHEQCLDSAAPTMRNIDEAGSPAGAVLATPTSITHEGLGNAPAGFWAQTSNDIFQNVQDLHEQIERYFRTRAPEEGFPQILVFCVYMCGSLASYLWKFPQLCPTLASRAEGIAQHSLEVLTALHAAWPTSANWQKGLQQTATPLTGPSPADDGGAAAYQSPTYPAPPQMGQTPGLVENSLMATDPPYGHLSSVGAPMEHRPMAPEGMIGELINALPNGHESLGRVASMQNNGLPTQLFDAELNAFLQGDFNYDLTDGWQNDYAA